MSLLTARSASLWLRPWRRLPSPGLRLTTAVLLSLLLLPVFAVIGTAFLGEAGDAPTSFAARGWAVLETAAYVGGVVLLSLLFALPAAWACVLFAFPGRRLAIWSLVLPFALPPYLTAYVYADLMQRAGFSAHGFAPAIFTTALSLYPYIFFLTYLSLRQQHCHIESVARLLEPSRWTVFWRISLPMARPAIVVGVVLVAMETLNDIAVAEYFGLQTLGLHFYDLWLNRNDVVGATRLAVLIMLFVLSLVAFESHHRRKQTQYVAACDRCYECERCVRLAGGRRVGLWAALLIPGLAGFAIPVAHLARLSFWAPADYWWRSVADGLAGSLFLAVALVVLLLFLGLLPVLDWRLNKRRFLTGALSQLARVTYALPGVVLAQGAFVLAALLGNVNDRWALFLSGGIGIVLLACSSRFYFIAAGSLGAAVEKISPEIDHVARLAAFSPARTFFFVHLPLLRGAFGVAAVIILLEGLKELPITLTLRPLNFDTLATLVYQHASDENLINAAPSALLLAMLAAAAVTVLFLMEGRSSRER